MDRYIIFTDDSGSADHQYHALSIIAVPAFELDGIQARASSFGWCSTGCVEWKTLKNAPERYDAASEVLMNTFTLVEQYGGRVHTLLWDMLEPRHDVVGRDDARNKEYMYRMALVDLIGRNPVSTIEWYHDTDGQLDFGRIARDVAWCCRGDVRFDRIEASAPRVDPLVQMADLNAGLWRFYYDNADRHEAWQKEGAPSVSAGSIFTRGDIHRFNLIDSYVSALKVKGYETSTWDCPCRTTVRGYRGLNVWPYMSQGAYDRAPRRAA